MHGLESHRDLKVDRGQRVLKPIDPVTDERRVRLDDDLIEIGDVTGDRAVIALRHGARVEEVRRVVELEARDGFVTLPPRLPGGADLRRNCASQRVSQLSTARDRTSRSATDHGRRRPCRQRDRAVLDDRRRSRQQSATDRGEDAVPGIQDETIALGRRGGVRVM
jgi:hypothetical protein